MFFSICGTFLASIRCSAPAVGGARRDRTADLLRAKQALSRLSYGPELCLPQNGMRKISQPTYQRKATQGQDTNR